MTYTQDQFDHYMEVGSDSRFEYCMARQLMEELKALRSTNKTMSKLMTADEESRSVLVHNYKALESDIAELEALLDGVTK